MLDTRYVRSMTDKVHVHDMLTRRLRGSTDILTGEQRGSTEEFVR
jgi:hypothetical protein